MKRWLPVTVALLALGAVIVVPLLIGRVGGADFARDHSCLGVPRPGSPFGGLTACRVLDQRTVLIGRVAAQAHVLLGTDRGLVVLRMDYFEIVSDRDYWQTAVEVGPDEVTSGLSNAEKTEWADDLHRRGGPRGEVWTVGFGRE